MALSVRALSPDLASAITELHAGIYPPQMREREETVRKIIEQAPYAKGLFRGTELIGYLLTELQDDGTVYIYDIGVKKRHQGRGNLSTLLSEFFSAMRKERRPVALHCRYTSHPIFSDPQRMSRYGYRIAKDELLPDWYYGEFGIREDAHFLRLDPE